MADSEDKKKSESPKNFADDLDAMLDDAASSIDSDEIMSDDDAIDKLLMESAFDEQEPLDGEDDDFENLFADTLEEPKPVIDEIGDALTDDESRLSESGFDQSERRNDSTEDSAMVEIDEFSDVDELAETEPAVAISPPVKEENEPLAEKDIDNDDFTLAEFDISDSENQDDEFEALPEENTIIDTEEETPQILDQTEESAQEQALTEPDFNVYDDSSTFSDEMPEAVDNNTVVNEEVAAQISQLLIEQAMLKEQISALSALKDSGQSSEDLKRLSNVESQLKKQLDSGAKLLKITYAAIAIAAIALITAGVFAYLVIKNETEIDSLTELVGTLEENQTELNALVRKGGMPQVSELSPAPIVAQDETADAESTAIVPLSPAVPPESDKIKADGLVSPDEKQTESIDIVQTTSVDTVKKSEQPEDSIVAAEESEKARQIKALEAKIEKLEKKLAAATAPPVKNAVSKPPAPVRRSAPRARVPAASWSVNLISFKQDWYANRKAAEFSRQGVPAKVTAVQVKGETWYRLSVPGFNSRDEASAYAARVKKTHNLDSVWISRE